MFFIKLLAGQSSDKITFINDQTKLQAYNTLALGLMGMFFIVLAMMNPYEQRGQCLAVLIAATCILGFNSGGFFKSSQMVSRQHSHFTLANISFVGGGGCSVVGWWVGSGYATDVANLAQLRLHAHRPADERVDSARE
jgi:hypothetical protein